MDLERAIQAAPDGVRLLFEVVPGASDTRVPSGWNPWRHRLQARVAAPPEDGKANAALEAALAEALEVPAATVQVTAGHTARRKTLTIRAQDAGLDAATVRQRLERLLENADATP